MADLTAQQFKDAARKAAQDGDTATARKLLERARKAEAASPPADPQNPDGTYGQPPEGVVANPYTGQMTERDLLAGHAQKKGVSNTESTARGVLRGGTFGGADELLGAANAVVPGPGTMQERYDFGRESMRAQEQAAQKENPLMFAGGELGGGAAAALAYGMPAVAGRGLGGAMAAGAGVGAAEGMTYGALTGEGGEDRAKRALQYGTMGAALGAGVPVATAGAKKVFDVGRDVVGGGADAVRGRASQDRANRAIAKTLMKSGKSADDVQGALSAAARDGQPEYRVMDALGVPGQRRASSIARSGGDSSAEIADFLDQRQLDQPERVAGAVEDAFDLAGTSSQATRRAITEGRDKAADLNFGAIRSSNEPVDIRGVVDKIDSVLGPYEKAGVSDEGIDAIRSLRRQLINEGADETYELSNFDKVFAIRKRLRDRVNTLYKKGENELAKELKGIRQEMDNALAASNPSYRQAMDEFSKSSRVIDAGEAGEMMSRPGRRAIDTTSEFSQMTPSEQAAARVGYGDKALTKIEASAGGANRARPLTSTKAQKEAQTMAIDPDLYQRRIGREMDMFDTRNKAVGGSRTADNLEDIQELQGVDAGPIVSALRGDLKGAALTAGQRGINVATGMNDSTRQLIARALMSGDAEPIKIALRQAETSQARKAIIDSLIRSGAVRNSGPIQEQIGSLSK